jgi:hypothetical protein
MDYTRIKNVFIFKLVENSFYLTRETNHQIPKIHKRVIKKAKNREKNGYISNANNKTKSVANNKQRIREIPSI